MFHKCFRMKFVILELGVNLLLHGSDHLVEYPRRTSNTTLVQVGTIDRDGVVNVRVVNESIEHTNRVGVSDFPCVGVNRTKLKKVENIVGETGSQRIDVGAISSRKILKLFNNRPTTVPLRICVRHFLKFFTETD